MRIEIYKKDNKFYIMPHIYDDTTSKDHECGYVYELDLYTGEFVMDDWVTKQYGWIQREYVAVGWCEVNSVESWHIAPSALGKQRMDANCFISKSFMEDENESKL